jgi:Sulfotransferase domain
MRPVPVAFCIGLNRTGTTTFGDACEMLGFTRMGWTYSQTEFPSHRLMRFWEKGNIDGLIETATGYDVLEDLPWPLVYREMAEAFPDAKFALTRRSTPDAWLGSIAKHTAGAGEYGMHAKIYGSTSAIRDPELYLAYYERHLSEVREFFAGSDRFVELCWEDGDGWPQLCGLLGVPEPDVNFPHSNTAGSHPPRRRRRRRWVVRKARKLRRRARRLLES